MHQLSAVIVAGIAVAMVVLATIAVVTGRLRWRITAGVVAGAVLVAGLVLERGLGHATAAGIAFTAGFLVLLALAFHFALRELGALDPPPAASGVLESSPDVLSVDLTDRDA